MNNKPLISIATPCWNSASTIERTIKSVLTQEFKDYEYIIVDGGSTDGTLDIIKKYEPLFEGRMKWKSERDKGLYDAFNKGVERSSGIYCWNVNADDYIEPDALSNLSEIIRAVDTNQDYPVIVGALNYVDNNGHFLSVSKFSPERIQQNYDRDAMIPHPATVVPKAVYEKYGKFDTRFKVAADQDWFNRVYAKNVPFVTTEYVLSNMSLDGVSNHQRYSVAAREKWLMFNHKYTNLCKRVIRFIIWNLRYIKKL